MDSLLTDALIEAVVRQLAINPRGLHGLSHWARVYANGMRLAQANGADIDVVELFALFHDSRRLTENADPEHGPRGADFAKQLHGSLFTLDQKKLELLLAACRLHTAAPTHAHVTVQTCFDADRLDLARIGKIVDPHYLCTPIAKDPQTIAWADAQSRCHIVPDNPLGRFLQTPN
jgi:uncharacterized protein